MLLCTQVFSECGYLFTQVIEPPNKHYYLLLKDMALAKIFGELNNALFIQYVKPNFSSLLASIQRKVLKVWS